jgi:hypothetical protein
MVLLPINLTNQFCSSNWKKKNRYEIEINEERVEQLTTLATILEPFEEATSVLQDKNLFIFEEVFTIYNLKHNLLNINTKNKILLLLLSNIL